MTMHATIKPPIAIQKLWTTESWQIVPLRTRRPDIVLPNRRVVLARQSEKLVSPRHNETMYKSKAWTNQFNCPNFVCRITVTVGQKLTKKERNIVRQDQQHYQL
jgi:hypothetical protein